MGVQVAGTSVHWSSQLLPAHAPSPSQASTAISSLCSRRKGSTSGGGGGFDHALRHQILDHRHWSPFLGACSLRFSRAQSLELPSSGRGRRIQERALRRASSASLDSFADDDGDDEDEEEFVRRLHELAVKLEQESSCTAEESTSGRSDASSSSASASPHSSSLPIPPPLMLPSSPFLPLSTNTAPSAQPPCIPVRPEPPAWADRDAAVPASVERNANRVDLPLSLRIIKRKKKRWEEELMAAGGSACCSVKKAFSSMVFIIRELHSFALQMREALFYEDLQGILARVQQEMHASFVWLFQQIFSSTPTLMVSVMLLLANFTVYSMDHHAAIAAAKPNPPHQSIITLVDNHDQNQQPLRVDASAIKTFSIGRTASVGGSGGGGGGKARPVAGATDDGRSDGPSQSRTSLPDGMSTVPAAVTEEEEAMVWNRMAEEARRMQASTRDEALMAPEILRQLVSPVTVEVEPEEPSDYLRAELTYQQALSQEPENALLLANFAQFLYLVLHDHDRAEYYFKRAVRVEPADAESLSKYASFLWMARKDLAAAEETYLEAIAADPGNTVHAANYAHFLWSTGGEDTCYPLDGLGQC